MYGKHCYMLLLYVKRAGMIIQGVYQTKETGEEAFNDLVEKVEAGQIAPDVLVCLAVTPLDKPFEYPAYGDFKRMGSPMDFVLVKDMEE